jgi:hypothetical protein
MFTRRRIEQLLAASMYEPLSAEEAAWLERKLAKYPEYRAMQADFRRMVAAIPAEPVAFGGDMLPLVRAAVVSSPQRGLAPGWGRGLAGAFAGACVVLLAAYVGLNAAQTLRPSLEVAGTVTPMQRALGEAEHLAGQRDFSAITLLREALAQSPEAPEAGEAQLLLARLEFEHGERYAEAHEALNTLRTKYWDTWSAHPECAAQFALLDDARAEDFAPLYALDRARRGGSFETLENLAAQYPGRLLAAAAIDAMREVAGGLDNPGSAFRAAALETVRSRCTNPITIAQIDVQLGELYWKGLNDNERARSFFCNAQRSGHLVVAQAAMDALKVLGACPPTAP